jgi:hypothetical protein
MYLWRPVSAKAVVENILIPLFTFMVSPVSNVFGVLSFLNRKNVDENKLNLFRMQN